MNPNNQVLHSNQDTGEPFSNSTPFVVFLDTYTDGWFVEYAIDDDDVSDKDTLNWKRYHNQPIQEHGDLSHVLVYGMADVLYRLNGGTQGATAVSQAVQIAQRQ